VTLGDKQLWRTWRSPPYLEILGLFIAENLRHGKEYVMGAIAAVVLSGFVVLVLIGTFVAEERRQRKY